MNAGTRARTAYYLFLPDAEAEILAGDSADLGQAFAFQRRIGPVGPRSVDETERPRPSVRRFPTITTLLLCHLRLHRWEGRLRASRGNFMVGPNDAARCQNAPHRRR